MVDLIGKNVFADLKRSRSLFWRLFFRGIRTITKFRLLTKIDFNVMHLVSLCKFFFGKNCKFVGPGTSKIQYFTQPQFGLYSSKKFWYEFFCKFFLQSANLVSQNQLDAFLLHNIVKICQKWLKTVWILEVPGLTNLQFLPKKFAQTY